MRVTALNIFPIKACRGCAVTSITIDALGPVGDRRLMLVDDEGGFLSQRELPRLATLAPRLDGPLLEVAADGHECFVHELNPLGPQRRVTVWGGSLLAHDQGDAAAHWFSDALAHPCRLVQFGVASKNPIDPDYTPRPDAQTTFTDGYPLLAVMEESLQDLNTRLREPVPMERFRPNVVIRGAPAWSEDEWRIISLGSVTCDQAKPCARCAVTTTDQRTGARHPDQEPLRTLASFRTIPGFGAIFGQNLVPRGTGHVQVGDEVLLG